MNLIQFPVNVNKIVGNLQQLLGGSDMVENPFEGLYSMF